MDTGEDVEASGASFPLGFTLNGPSSQEEAHGQAREADAEVGRARRVQGEGGGSQGGDETAGAY